MKYELWIANERFIMGKKIRTYKTLESALKRANKEINFTYKEYNHDKDILYLDSETHRPLGLIKIIKD